MALTTKPGFVHIGAHLPQPQGNAFVKLREELGITNSRMIELGVEALRRQLDAEQPGTGLKIPPRREAP
jgi:hypothetical protein